MQTALTIVNAISNGEVVTLNAKGKTGSFARAIAFASRDERIKAGQSMYLTWLSNGQYRPVVNDIIDVLVTKSAQSFIKHIVPETGPIRKEHLMQLCTMVDASVRESGKELKGQKAFVYGIVERIAAEANPATVEA